VYRARILDKITHIRREKIQDTLNRLVVTNEFQKVLKAEVAQRGLEPGDVIPSLQVVYHEVSKHAHGNDGAITLCTTDHTDNELGALIMFLRVQESWDDGLKWRVVKKWEAGGEEEEEK